MCAATPYGVILRNVEKCKVGDKFVLLTHRAKPGEKCWTLVQLIKPDRWKMSALRALCPNELRILGTYQQIHNTQCIY